MLRGPYCVRYCETHTMEKDQHYGYDQLSVHIDPRDICVLSQHPPSQRSAVMQQARAGVGGSTSSAMKSAYRSKLKGSCALLWLLF